jgi:hypothetical protein
MSGETWNAFGKTSIRFGGIPASSWTTEKAMEKVMEKDRETYTSYLLRLWPTKSGDSWVWHASLEDSRTGVRRGFISLEEMFAFLKEQTSRLLNS